MARPALEHEDSHGSSPSTSSHWLRSRPKRARPLWLTAAAGHQWVGRSNRPTARPITPATTLRVRKS